MTTLVSTLDPRSPAYADAAEVICGRLTMATAARLVTEWAGDPGAVVETLSGHTTGPVHANLPQKTALVVTAADVEGPAVAVPALANSPDA